MNPLRSKNKPEKQQDKVKKGTEEAADSKGRVEGKRKVESKKTLAKPYSTLDDEHKAILEPNTFMGAVVEVAKPVSSTLLTSHLLTLGAKTNYTFGTRYMSKRCAVRGSLSTNGVAQANISAGIPEAVVEGGLTVIPQFQTGFYKPVGGPTLSSSAGMCLSSQYGTLTGKVSSSPSGFMASSSCSVAATGDIKIKGQPNSFTLMGGCEYCFVKERESSNLVSGGIKVKHNSRQPTEALVTVNNLGIVTSSVLKEIPFQLKKDNSVLSSGSGVMTVSPCCELQFNSNSLKSCLTFGLKAQKYDSDCKVVKGCTASVDTNGGCCCVFSSSLGKKKLSDMKFNASLEGNLFKQEWCTGFGVSW